MRVFSIPPLTHVHAKEQHAQHAHEVISNRRQVILRCSIQKRFTPATAEDKTCNLEVSFGTVGADKRHNSNFFSYH